MTLKQIEYILFRKTIKNFKKTYENVYKKINHIH